MQCDVSVQRAIKYTRNTQQLNVIVISTDMIGFLQC